MPPRNIWNLAESSRCAVALISPLDAERIRSGDSAFGERARRRRAADFATAHAAASVPDATVRSAAIVRATRRYGRPIERIAADTRRRVALHHRAIPVRFQQNSALHRQQAQASLRRAVRDLRNHRRHEQEASHFSLRRSAACQAVGCCAGHRREPEANRLRSWLPQAQRRRARRYRKRFAHEVLRFLRHLDQRSSRTVVDAIRPSPRHLRRASWFVAARVDATITRASDTVAPINPLVIPRPAGFWTVPRNLLLPYGFRRGTVRQ